MPSKKKFKTLLKKHEKREILDASRLLDLFSTKHKPIFQMIVSEKITNENIDQIELEIATKIVLFERKLLKLTSTTKKMTKRAKINLQVKHLYPEFTGPEYNFELEVESTLTIGELARAIGEV